MNDDNLREVVLKRLAEEARIINDDHKYTLKLDIRDEERQLWHVTFECPDTSAYADEAFTI